MSNQEQNRRDAESDTDSSSGGNQVDFSESYGFKLFLRHFRKKYPTMTRDEAKKYATYTYARMPEHKLQKYRPVQWRRPPPMIPTAVAAAPAPSRRTQSASPGEQQQCESPQDACCARRSCHDKRDTCCKKCDPDDDDCCEPSGTGSLGFRNFYKVFRCRYPYYSKCTALAKAQCKYCQLGEKAKFKYRIMGCNPKICCKPRLQCPC